mmetsp:Transcript_4294/g.4921  ORF Transcript_4294/g.4921 Transcript_4294/m.4921 type:complete len:271 (+) Transcript_4294:29-841(+)
MQHINYDVSRLFSPHLAFAFAPAIPLQTAILQLESWCVAPIWSLQGRVWQGIGDSSQGGIALVIELAIRKAKLPEEDPNVVIGPLHDGVDAHKCGPAIRGRGEGIHSSHPRIFAALTHHHSLHVVGDQGFHAIAKGLVLQNDHFQVQAANGPSYKSLHFDKLVARIKEDHAWCFVQFFVDRPQHRKPQIQHDTCIFATIEGHRQFPKLRIELGPSPANARGLEKNGCKSLVFYSEFLQQTLPQSSLILFTEHFSQALNGPTTKMSHCKTV